MSILPDWNSIESTARWSDILFWAGIVSLILLAATEVASHVYGSRSSYLVTEATRLDSIRREEADTRAKQQRADDQKKFDAEAAKLRQRLEDANRAAAEAQQSATEARTTVAKVQKQGADRKLTDTQKSEIIAAISPFRGQKITIGCNLGDGESEAYMRDFIAVFDAAGWDHGGGTGFYKGSGSPVGIEIRTHELTPAVGQVNKAIYTLWEVLIRLGLMTRDELTARPDIEEKQFEMRIGRKPPLQ